MRFYCPRAPGRSLSTRPPSPRMIWNIRSGASCLRLERGFVAVKRGGRLVPKASRGIVLRGDMREWPISKTMLRRVLETGMPLLAADALHDARYGDVRSVGLQNIRSVMCCPLGHPDAPKGVLYVDNRQAAGAFTRLDLEFLNALAHYALLAIEASEERQRLVAEKEVEAARWRSLRDDVSPEPRIVGASEAIQAAWTMARKAAQSDLAVMLVGETGVGKELFARFVHASSPRARGPFIPVHAAALPETLVESELFGHERGSFTGAVGRRIGRFEQANGGTLFLDEVLDIPLNVQAKLLRVLEERKFQRLGGNEDVEADVRVISACNRDPEQEVRAGRLREDLYWRLNSVVLDIPPLRERREDIVPLAQHFLGKCGSQKRLDEAALAALENYHWPGNVRELLHCVEWLVAFTEGPLICREDLPPRLRGGGAAGAPGAFEPLPELIARIEREHFAKALRLADGNNEKAIRLLGVSRAKFFQRKKDYGL